MTTGHPNRSGHPGPFYEAIVAFEGGALHIESTETAIIAARFLPPISPGASRPGHSLMVDDAPPVLRQACKQLIEYFSGQRRDFDLPFDWLAGSEFQRKVWLALQQIPYGATWSYEELASHVAKVGQLPRQLARAVGSACRTNPLPVFVPCHRVIGKNGRLVGFAGGVEVKAYLLNHEMLGI